MRIGAHVLAAGGPLDLILETPLDEMRTEEITLLCNMRSKWQKK
jgi:hypothetical protein